MLSPALREFHDRVFVVTAPGFEERQHQVQNELGFRNFEFIFGVNKNDSSKAKFIAEGVYDEKRAIELDRSSKPMTLGHICCSIGHASVYRRMIDEGVGRALIFEDDVLVLPVAEEKIEAAISTVPQNAELIYWGWQAKTRPPRHAWLKKWLYKRQNDFGLLKYSHTMIDNLYPGDFNDHFMRAGKTFCTHAYSVTRSAAEKLLSLNTPIALNADNALMYAVLTGEVTAYISKQKLFGQRSLDVLDPVRSLTEE